MVRVLLVHGAFNEFWGPHELKVRWLPALRDGLWRTTWKSPKFRAKYFIITFIKYYYLSPLVPNITIKNVTYDTHEIPSYTSH